MSYIRYTDYERDRKWSDYYIPQLTTIIRAQAYHIVSVETATDDEDHRCIADMKIVVSSGDVLCRVRATHYRDLTLRSWRASGVSTEAAKIVSGAGRWYLYAWTSTTDLERIDDWMLLDLDRLRASGLIESAQEIRNRDGRTGFVTIPRDPDLRQAGVLVAEKGQATERNQALDTLRTIAQTSMF